MIDIIGMVRFHIDGLRGPVDSPSRSFVLGDPKAGAVYGCIIDLADQQVIEPGSAGPARIHIIGDALPDWPEPWPIWAGRVIGEVSSIHHVDAGL